MQRLLAVKEVAGILNITPHSVYCLVAKEKIPHARVSKRTIRFESCVLEEWIKSISFAEKRRE